MENGRNGGGEGGKEKRREVGKDGGMLEDALKCLSWNDIPQPSDCNSISECDQHEATQHNLVLFAKHANNSTGNRHIPEYKCAGRTRLASLRS
ncbi:hypothetical protein DPMN_151062 [Dreissena polymorpha]|uniref:Uncharacterized protein n=1 Tax=Dreissena polymorpha TaxID=45954 RepID=A0A9D4J2M2_DREPO|nr:hypothetical protein DPMN_151062 [Dreissena polymorpha]